MVHTNCSLHFVHRQLQFRFGCRVVDEQAATGSTGPHRHYARDVTLDLLEEAFLSEADAHLNSWSDPLTSALPLTVIKTAVAYAQGHGLACCVREKNIDCVSVVRTERLIEHYNDMNSIGPISIQVLCYVPTGKRSAGKMWASRWRRKHKVIVASLNVRDPIDVGETRLKVGCMCLMNCMHIVSPLISSDCGGTALCIDENRYFLMSGLFSL